MFRVIFVAVALSIFFSTTTSVLASNDSFKQFLSEVGNNGEMVGLAVAVVRGGEIDILETYGVPEINGTERITPDTLFRIASLSKAFAATVTAELVNEGKLSLEDSIIEYNPDFSLKSKSQAEAVTISHTLSHRLSLPPYAYDNLLEADKSPPSILRAMKKVKPICKVGECYAYQNVGFNMITSAIERVDHKPYTVSVKERLFEPLGMLDASFGSENLKHQGNWARSYSRKKNGPWKIRRVRDAYYNVPAAGGVNASIIDMTKWLSAQMGYAPDILPRSTLTLVHTPLVRTPREMMRNRRMPRLSNAHYGLGWRIYEYAGQDVINHSGSVEGYSSQIAFLPEHDVGIVLLTNSRTDEFWSILPVFLDAELGLDNPLLVD